MAATNHNPLDPGPLVEQLLARYGSRLEDTSRPSDGQSNAVWIADTFVLRIGLNGDGSLRREAALAARLPATVGYPVVLGSGLEDGWEWVVAERLPGVDLATAWPGLDDAARCAAVADLWARLEALHRWDPEPARRLGCSTTPFYALDPRRAAQQLHTCVAEGALDGELLAAIEAALERVFGALASMPVALCHTDAHAGNTMWDGRRAIPIDFEFAAVGPADLDVEILLRSFAAEPGPAARLLLDLAQGDLARGGARERIVGYAVLRDVWAMTKWLGNSSDRDDIDTWAPLLNLQGHVRGTSWVAQLWT